jgi:hypothetical protein
VPQIGVDPGQIALDIGRQFEAADRAALGSRMCSEILISLPVGLLACWPKERVRKGYRGPFVSSHDGCACRKLNPDILMVQSAQHWPAENVSGPLNGARGRRVLVQR